MGTILGMAILFNAASVTALPIVSVDTDPFTTGVQSAVETGLGNPLTIDVVVSGIDPLLPLNAFEFELHLDTTILSPTDVVSGGFLGPFFPSGTAFLVESDITGPDIGYAETSLVPTGFSGDGRLATITFDTIGLGTSALELSEVILSAPFGAPIDLAGVNDGSVNVVPEPSTLFLLGSGIIVLAGWRKRRRFIP